VLLSIVLLMVWVDVYLCLALRDSVYLFMLTEKIIYFRKKERR
jgi:hypothetical protein